MRPVSISGQRIFRLRLIFRHNGLITSSLVTASFITGQSYTAFEFLSSSLPRLRGIRSGQELAEEGDEQSQTDQQQMQPVAQMCFAADEEPRCHNVKSEHAADQNDLPKQDAA